MNEYISKQKVLDYLNGYLHSLGEDADTLFNRGQRRALINSIQDILAVKGADVQQVVHCKDCKYAQNPNDTMVYCTYFECGTMSQNDFCSQGEDGDTE